MKLSCRPKRRGKDQVGAFQRHWLITFGNPGLRHAFDIDGLEPRRQIMAFDGQAPWSCSSVQRRRRPGRQLRTKATLTGSSWVREEARGQTGGQVRVAGQESSALSSVNIPCCVVANGASARAWKAGPATAGARPAEMTTRTGSWPGRERPTATAFRSTPSPSARSAISSRVNSASAGRPAQRPGRLAVGGG